MVGVYARRPLTEPVLTGLRSLADALAVGVQRKIAEEASHALEAQLRHAQKMEAVGRLAGGIAHDFNNVLSVVLGYAEMVLGDLKVGDPLRDDVNEIHKAAKRAAGLTQQLLMFSRRQVIAPKVLDLNEVLSGMARMLQRLVGEDVELVSVPGAALGRVRVDPGSMEQVIMNLAVNARDAMPTGGKLTMKTENVVLDEEYASSHLGAKAGATSCSRPRTPAVGWMGQRWPGSSSRSSRPRSWERAPVSVSPRSSASCSRAADTSGCAASPAGARPSRSISLESKRWPRSRVRHRTPRPCAVRRPSCWWKMNRKFVTWHAGSCVDTAMPSSRRATPPRHCWWWPHAGTIDLLLTDVVMPGMNGPELAKRLVQERPEMKVLCMSGYTDDAAVRNGVMNAAFAYLQKPLTVGGLTRKVRDVLDARRG